MFRPSLHHDIVCTMKIFLGTARWYGTHDIEQFVEYSHLVNSADLTKIDFDEAFLVDVSRTVDVWAGHQLTQVRHMVVATSNLEKLFDVPVWGNRKSVILEASSDRSREDVFRTEIPKFAVRNWKAFLSLNRAYESHTGNLIGYAQPLDLSFLSYRISDFLRILRSARLEFLVKDPHSVKSPALCLYGILTGIADEEPESALPLEGSTLTKIRLNDTSGESVYFYLSPEDYSGLLAISGQTSLRHRKVITLAKCRLSNNLFKGVAEIVPIRIWLIEDPEYGSAQSLATLRLRIKFKTTDDDPHFRVVADHGFAILEGNMLQYNPIACKLDDLLASNPVLMKISQGTRFEDLTQDLREVSRIIQRPIALRVPQEALRSIELVLRAFYPNAITEDRIADWTDLLLSDFSSDNPVARNALLHRHLWNLRATGKAIDSAKETWRVSKCSEEVTLHDEELEKYLVLLVSISPSIRVDTLVKKTIRTLGLGKSREAHIEGLITKLVSDGRMCQYGKNVLQPPGKLPEDLVTEDRSDEIDRLMMNILRERISTCESIETMYCIVSKKVPDLKLEELRELIQQHLQKGDIVSDFQNLYAITVPPQESRERRDRYTKKHFPSKMPSVTPDQIRASIIDVLHRCAPKKIRLPSLCEQVMTSARGSTRVEVTKAIQSLCNEQVVLVDKLGRFVENPNPPQWKLNKRPEKAKAAILSAVSLHGKEVLVLQSFARAHQSGIIYARRRNRTNIVFVKSYAESEKILAKLLTDLSSGEINSLRFEDHLGSQVMVWSENGMLAASYSGSSHATGMLRDVLSKCNY